MDLRAALTSAAVFATVAALAACSAHTDGAARPTGTGPTTTAPTTTAPGAGGAAASDTTGVHRRITVAVGATTRTAELVTPDDLSRPAPLVVAFHGHGGSGRTFEHTMGIEDRWPEAVVVYPDGLVGHVGRTDPTGVRSGWQTAPGEDGDRDLAFYDALMAQLRAMLPIDPDRVFLVGHSNGSGLVSFLLDVRGDGVAATANLSSQPGPYLRTDPARSMFMSMGRADRIVPYANQVRSVPLAERLIGADPATRTVAGYLSTEHGRGGLELAVYDHPGGHPVPREVPALVVAFLRRHTRSGG
jgi:polyhydroxybutyrate depolymerase